MLGKIEEKGTKEDEMVGRHHRLDGHAFDQAPGDADGQGSLARCSPWGHKQLDMTEQLIWTDKYNKHDTQYLLNLIHVKTELYLKRICELDYSHFERIPNYFWIM